MSTMTEIRDPKELLKDVKLLAVFTDTELAQLYQLGKPSSAEAYTNIVIEGELSWGLYLILNGSLGVFKKNRFSGTLYDVGTLEKGGFFGEMSLVDDNPRSATVRALSDVQLFFISKELFQQWLSKGSNRKERFYESCVTTLVHRLRELDDNYVITQYQLWKTALRKEREAG
jgi:CRP-like cAMP-binding protein